MKSAILSSHQHVPWPVIVLIQQLTMVHRCDLLLCIKVDCVGFLSTNFMKWTYVIYNVQVNNTTLYNYADKQFIMPASLNPFQTILGLSLKYKNMDSIHLALNGLIKLTFISIGITSVDCFCNCLCNFLEYQSWNCEHKKSLVELLTDKSSSCSRSVQLAGSKTISKLWPSKTWE